MPSLSATLRQLRQARRLSQLELSLCLEVSQRHVSFVESGRTRPSRALLMTWLQELEAPLVVRNQALLEAGYAPVYSHLPLDDPALAQADAALQHLLNAHDPMPALVIDAGWNLLRLNRGGQWLAATLMPAIDLGDSLGNGASINLLDLLAHPEGFTKPIVNLQEVGPAMLSILRHEASMQPDLAPRVEAIAALLGDRLGSQNLNQRELSPSTPILTTRYATAHGELAFFSTFTTFGTPRDITLASLRVEHLFAADDATRALVNAQVR
ncbi:XRE family transcriptional regulator [filamentous cyanobacterium CCP5]|nr:XRE family transcriptional regulator [filamentous cyanobacterium CCP5]